jgi:hypothetical protein
MSRVNECAFVFLIETSHAAVFQVISLRCVNTSMCACTNTAALHRICLCTTLYMHHCANTQITHKHSVNKSESDFLTTAVYIMVVFMLFMVIADACVVLTAITVFMKPLEVCIILYHNISSLH